MTGVRSLAVVGSVACAVPLLVAAGTARGASAMAPASSVTSSSTIPSASATPPASASASASEEAHEITVETLDGSDTRDPQFFTAGLEAGPGWVATHGSAGSGDPSLLIAATIDIGLGEGGARIPWSLEPFLSITLGRFVFINNAQEHLPDYYTIGGARLVWRDPTNFLSHQWVSIGTGLVITDCCLVTAARPTATQPGRAAGTQEVVGALLDLGLGIYENTTRRTRMGIALRAPIELSSHIGAGVFLDYYIQLGVID